MYAPKMLTIVVVITSEWMNILDLWKYFSFHTGVATIDDLLEGIQSKDVDYGLVDVSNLVPYKKQLQKMNIKILALERVNSGFGLILSGLSTALINDVEDAIAGKAQLIAEFKETYSDSIPVSALDFAMWIPIWYENSYTLIDSNTWYLKNSMLDISNLSDEFSIIKN